MHALKQVKNAESSIYDLAFIDGLHYYEFVLNDLLLSYDRLKPEGILVFDDYECRFDVLDWTEIKNKDYVSNQKMELCFILVSLKQ